MIETLEDFPGNVLAFACHGHITRQDYETVLIPQVEAALKTRDKLRLYYRIDADFNGIDPMAVWEDFKIGMEHVTRWERIAVVTDIPWITHMMNFMGFMIPAKMKVFPTVDKAEARDWIVAA